MIDLGSPIDSKDVVRLSDQLYKQHNALTSGRYDFTACQLDIMFMILACLKPGQLTYQIHTSDIELITGRKWNIIQLTNSTQAMLTRMFEVEAEDGYTQFVLFQYFKYLKGTRTIEVKLSDISLPYFFDLKNNFTHFQLKSVLQCTSSYAKRLYTIACQWRSIGGFPKPIPIRDLKKMLGLVDAKGFEQYTQIGQFKQKVLEVAKQQINANTDITFDYKLYKRGRTFDSIQIFVSRPKDADHALQAEIDFSRELDLQRDIKSVMAYGLSQEQAELIVKHDYGEFVRLVDDLQTKIKRGQLVLDNSTAYIIGIYQKKGIIPQKEK